VGTAVTSFPDLPEFRAPGKGEQEPLGVAAGRGGTPREADGSAESGVAGRLGAVPGMVLGLLSAASRSRRLVPPVGPCRLLTALVS
jgi:hypothetical protein